MKIYEYTLTEASKLIHEGTLTPLKLAESLLCRIQNLEPTLEAWVSVDHEQVLKDAEEATAQALENEFKSPLHGIPVAIKDIFYTKGMRTTMGSTIYSNFTPEFDADTVKVLKDSGLIVLGKTETTEFALHDPAPTRNPWNTKHTPGGSSSGSAAAVSSGMAQLALGTQTGGSIIRPASYCGIVGFKGTYDLLSRKGVFPVSWSLDHVGFMTRTVKDIALTLKTIKKEIAPGFEFEGLPSLGLFSGYFKENSEDEVWLGFERAVGKLWGEGADFVDVQLPESFNMVPDVHRLIMSVEAASAHEDTFREQPDGYREYVQGLISSGLLVPATAYLRAQRIRRIIIEDLLKLFKGYDCLVCPATIDTPPKGLEWTGSPAFNAPWSLTGFPVITVPSGISEDGLPLGLQLVGKPYGELELLQVAEWCEEQLEFPKEPKEPYTP